VNCNDALFLERQPRKSGGPRKVYLFKCVVEECGEIVKIRSAHLHTASGLCMTHSHTKRPFESLYNGLFHDHRGVDVGLTYRQFLEFTKITECHYCGDVIPWRPYGTVKGSYKSRAYFLDRKDHNDGYNKSNCVVCCTRCNITRSNRFTYEQFVQIGALIKSW
jgi:hypothetical protein